MIFKGLNYFNVLKVNFCENFNVVIGQNDVTTCKNTKNEVVTMTPKAKVSFFLDLHLCLTCSFAAGKS